MSNYNKNGRIEKLCMRYRCHQPIDVREYIIYTPHNPLFCPECWDVIYARREIRVEDNKISKNDYDKVKEIEREVIKEIIKPFSCEVRCSEHCGNPMKEKVDQD